MLRKILAHLFFIGIFAYLLYEFYAQGRHDEMLWPFAWIGGYVTALLVNSILNERKKEPTWTTVKSLRTKVK